jgi:hypothetical protein
MLGLAKMRKWPGASSGGSEEPWPVQSVQIAITGTDLCPPKYGTQLRLSPKVSPVPFEGNAVE